MIHNGALAFESALWASLLSCTFGMIAVYAWHLRLRPTYILFLAAGWFGLSFYFGVFAISAGPAPMLSRVTLAVCIRTTLIFSYLLFALWALCWVRCMLVRRGC